jgi:adenine-specific DNA-methyltransferase
MAQQQLALVDLHYTGSRLALGDRFRPDNDVTLFHGDCRELLSHVPAESAQLIVTSPPYNIGKKYEQRIGLAEYLDREREVISLCIERLRPGGSICWQVGNHVDQGDTCHWISNPPRPFVRINFDS